MQLRSPRPALLAAALLLLAIVSARAPAPVLAAGVLDASYESGGGASTVNLTTAGDAYGETFIAGRSGRVDRAGLRFQRHSSDVTVQFELWAISGGLPAGAPLATQQTVVTGNPLFPIDWIEVTFSSPAAVVAGQTYALMARWVSGPSINLIAKFPGEYAGGMVVALSPGPTSIPLMDINFRIYIDSLRLNLTATAAPNPVAPNQTLTYTFAVTNTGTSAANAVLLVDLPSVVQVLSGNITIEPLPAENGAPACRVITASRMACVLGSVAAGQGTVVAIPVRIISTTLGAQLCARGTVTGGPAGMTSTATAQACARSFIPPGDLAVTLDCPATAPPGVDLTTACTATVRNTGSYPLTVLAGQKLLRTEFSGSAGAYLFTSFPSVSGYSRGSYLAQSGGTFWGWVEYRATANDTIPAGGTRTFPASAIGTFSVPGTHTVTATVDPGSVIAEGNEANNGAGPVTTTISSP